MSHLASAYINALYICPNGERVTGPEKLLAFVLADYHQVGRPTYPSVKTLAEGALMDERTAQRKLASLEQKGVLRRYHPENQGRGVTTSYTFPEIDKGKLEEGGQSVTLPDELKRTAEGRQKDGRRTAEGRQKGDKKPRAYIEEQEQKQKQEQKQEQKPREPVSPAAGSRTDEAWMIAAAVIEGTGITNRWVTDTLVRQAEIELKEHPDDLDGIRDGMVGAWREYENCAKLEKLKFTMVSADKFFGEGKWKNWRLWGLKKGEKAYAPEVTLGT